MALLTTYTEANRVINTALTVTYSKRKIYGSWSYTNLNMQTTIGEAWEYSRHAVKSYTYVGMDYTTALACRSAMVALYARTTKVSEFSTSGATIGTFVTVDAGTQLMADIAVQHDDGGMYSVVVNVNEQDSRTSTSGSLSPASLFSTENVRTYDGETADNVPEEED